MADEEKDLDAQPDEELPPTPPKAKSVLMDILDRARDDTEAETARLMTSLKEREEAERLQRLEEENRKAEESRRKVEEERRKRETALKEYELRKAREAEAARMRAEMEKEASRPAQPEKSRGPVYAFAVVAAIAAFAAGVWFMLPKGEPVVFGLDRPLARAKPGTMTTSPVPFGAVTMESSEDPVAPDKLVLVVKPRKYEAPAPKPKTRVRRTVGKTRKKPKIKISTGILGGSKVIR